MIGLVLAKIRARRAQAWAVTLLALFATAASIAGPAYLTAVDTAVVNHEVAHATPSERSVDVGWQGPNDDSGLSYTQTLYTLSNLPGFTAILAENYQVLGLEPAPHAQTEMNFRQGACDHLLIVSGRCVAGTGEVVIGADTAKRLNIAPGHRVTLTYAVSDPVFTIFIPAGDPTELTVVGTYRPRDPGETYWGTHGYFTVAADGVPAEPIFASESTFEHLDHRAQLVTVDNFADPGTLTAAHLSTVATQIEQIKSQADGFTESRLSFQSDVPDLIDRIRAGQHLAHQIVPIAAIPLVLLAWFVIFLAVGYGADARRFELGLLGLRGVRLWVRWWLSLGESLLPIVLGSIGGFVVGQMTVGWLARARLGVAAPHLLSTVGWPYAVMAGAGAVLCAVLAQRRSISTAVPDLLREVVRPAGAWRAFAVELLVVVLAVVSVVQLHSSGGRLTGVSLLVPGLVMVAIAVLAGRAVVPVAARYGRFALHRGRTGTGLAALQLARRPGAQRLLVLLIVAVALLTFAATATDVAGQARANEAQVELGAQRVVSVEDVTRLQLLQAVRAVDPQGTFAMAVIHIEDKDPKQPPQLAIDSSRLPAVSAWRSDFGSLSPSAVAARLHPPAGNTLAFQGRRISFDADVSGFDPQADLMLTVNLAPTDGSTRLTVGLGQLVAGRHTYVGDVTACAPGCQVMGLAIAQGSQASYQAVLTLHQIVVDGRPIATAEQLGAAGAWSAASSATLSADAGGLTMNLNNASGQAGDAWLRPNDAPYPLPVVSTGDLAAGATLRFGANIPAVHQVAKVDGLPGLGNAGTYVDLEYVDRVVPDTGTAAGAQVWLGPAAPANVDQLLAEHGLVVRENQTIDGLRADLDGKGPALALWFNLLAAAFAIILATGAIALVAGVDRRRRTVDLAALRIQGLGRRSSGHAGLLGYLVVVLAAVVFGLVATAVAWWVTGAHLPVFQTVAQWPLPRLPRPGAVLLPILVIGALFVTVSVLAAAALSRSVARSR